MFFDSRTTEGGRELLIIRQQCWLFPAITVPLTILVFAAWLLWQRYRLSVNQITDIEHAREWTADELGLNIELPNDYTIAWNISNRLVNVTSFVYH